LKEIQEKKDVKVKNKYGMDEKGVFLGKVGCQKVLACRGVKNAFVTEG
jgi:hypothetical protein